MEKIVIQPREVRALGNIVSPKSKNDFLGSKISQGTATVQGIVSTVYTSTFLPVSKLTVEGEHFLKTDATLKLKVTVTDNHNTPIHSGKVYCNVNNTLYSASIKSNGTCELKIPGLTPGLHTLKIYYPGTSSIGGSFRDFTIVVGDDLTLEFFATWGLVQPGEYSELFGILTSLGVGVPGVKVDFYEEYILNAILLFVSKALIQTGETVDFTARVCDVDGSGIAEQLVEFYEEFDINFNLLFTPDLVQTGEYSEITAQLQDSDGSPIRNQQVKFYETYNPDRVWVTLNKDLTYPDGVVEVYGTLADIDGSRIPDNKVEFYEYFEYSNLTVMSSSDILQGGVSVDLSARLQDSDGSLIPDTLVEFYEYYNLTNLLVYMVPPAINTGETTDITAVLSDEDGSRIPDERVDFSTTVDSTGWSIKLNNPGNIIQVDDTVDFTATVKNAGGSAVSGIYVRFYDTNNEEE